MNSRKKTLAALVVVSALTVTQVGCNQLQTPDATAIAAESSHLSFMMEGSRPVEYLTLEQLAAKASAIVVVSLTGKTKSVALPPRHGGVAESAPVTFIELKVQRVLRGSLSADTIFLANPYSELWDDRVVVLADSSYLVFIAPAMHGANDPIGGYVAVGGSTGVYAATDDPHTFLRVSSDNPRLPDSITIRERALPEVTHTEEELLNLGP
jgi:hypothetical protein